MNIQSSGKTDVGLVRKNNEDSYKICSDKNLFIVCDGMGGHNAGDVASYMACNLIAELYCRHFDNLLKDERLALPRLLPPSTDVLTKAVRIANHWVYSKAAANPALSGMGTTIVAVALEDDIATLLHVGDSRIYLYNQGELTPLTTDHSWAAELEQTEKISPEEAQQLVNRNIITRALGVRESVDIDVAVRKVAENDTFILCSDGLCGFVDDDTIRRTVSGTKGDITKIPPLLVQLANDRGGSDNVTVVTVKVANKIEESTLPELETITIGSEPAEYFTVEEEWASKPKIPEKPIDTIEEPEKSSGFSGIVAGFFIIAVIAVIFYFILKG